MKIQVALQHIIQGTPSEMHSCPIALAVMEAMTNKDVIDLEVNSTVITVTQSNRSQLIGEIPIVGQKFISKFDELAHIYEDDVLYTPENRKELNLRKVCFKPFEMEINFNKWGAYNADL